jgi:nucleoside-diphosphate-sugar epimerase
MAAMKATIIGGKGFIGRHLVDRLIATGWSCRVPERHEVDNSQENMGHVFFCAGLTADYLRRPFETIEAHVSLLSRILQTNRFESLVYLSSTRLYDSQPGSEGKEEMPLLLTPANPRHLYDLSKALGESLCLATGKGRARIARLSCVYKDHTDGEGFLPMLLRRIIADNCLTLEVDSSPSFARDYVAVDDVVEALILIATQATQSIYNVASGENTSNDTLFTTLSKISGCRIIPLQARGAAANAAPRISIRRIAEEFGWKPVPVMEKIRTILAKNTTC